ncbi:hypothetical protein ABTK00_21595, partial [Acinetobacter baumannii]
MKLRAESGSHWNLDVPLSEAPPEPPTSPPAERSEGKGVQELQSAASTRRNYFDNALKAQSKPP